MSAEKRIDIILVTGFLGAGKTTFLNRLMTGTEGVKKGLLVNDFGEVPVDGALLKGASGEEGLVYEIGNGSIFCSCLKSSFLFGLQYFAKERPDILFIETSGLSDPTGFSRILENHGLDGEFRISSIICLADASKIRGISTVLEAPNRQVAAADIILLNKADLVSTEEIEGLRQMLTGKNPEARLLTGTYGEFPLPGILEHRRERDSGDWESCNTEENRPDSLFLDTGRMHRDAVARFLSAVTGEILRVKGFIQDGGETWYVSDTGDRFEWVPFSRTVSRYGLTVFPKPGSSAQVVQAWRACRNELKEDAV